MSTTCEVCIDNYDCHKCKHCSYTVCKPCNERYFRDNMFNIKCMSCDTPYKKKDYKYIISKDFIKKHHLKDNMFIAMINKYKQKKVEKIIKEHIHESERLYRAFAYDNGVRNCPNCNIPFQKNAGCNLMKCIACKYRFKYEDTHYNYLSQDINIRYQNVNINYNSLSDDQIAILTLGLILVALILLSLIGYYIFPSYTLMLLRMLIILITIIVVLDIVLMILDRMLLIRI